MKLLASLNRVVRRMLPGGKRESTSTNRSVARVICDKRTLKRALRSKGLHNSFFTKRRTLSRRKNYAEALAALPRHQQAAALLIWGRP